MSLPAQLSDPAPIRQRYIPAVGPRLRRLLYAVFGLVALLGANSAYLAAITLLEFCAGQVYQNHFYQYMFLAHLALGLLLIGPLVLFGILHALRARSRRNRRAVKIGYALLAVALAVLLTGLALMRIVGSFELKSPQVRSAIYWLHVAAPLAAAWLYWLHRLAGPRIKWRQGALYGGLVAAAVAAMILLHHQDPRVWHVVGPAEGTRYFQPSLARTADGNFIPAATLMMDHYCLNCHADIHAGWSHSAHRFSSFNNPAYLASVRETRQVSLQRDGHVKASRWCAGCHDPVPLFSGAFDDPKFDDVNHPTAHAGITCTTCHAITHVNSTRGNADYTIEEPLHYPFAASEHPLLQWINHQLVKAKPSFHKKTFLKDFHRSAEFCSTCHKVHLPQELTRYKEFLRGQNHYDSFLLSGVSGHSARSFYYPEKAVHNCAGCHMPLQASDDFGAAYFNGAMQRSIHDHLFPAANTGLAHLRNQPHIVQAHQQFLKDSVRVDLFGIREPGRIDGKLHAPLRPEIPPLEPGREYLLETVVRTLKLGHLFTQGTVDSNEVWLEVRVLAGDRLLAHSGAIDHRGAVDPWAHFLNVFLLDRQGNRISRRNPQDIFVPLYDHQIPPGAAAVVHYRLQVPAGLTEPITVEVKLQYRKFDQTYMEFVTGTARPGDPPIHGHQPGKPYRNNLPVTTLAADRITFPIGGMAGRPDQPAPDIPPWQRWNDYGIGLLLKGKAQLRQAAEAFAQVEKLGRYDGPLNLARTYYTEGRIAEAAEALRRAARAKDPAAPPWTLAWLSGLVQRDQGQLAEAEANFRSVLQMRTPEMLRRGFDFSRDYEVINLLGQTLFDRAKQAHGEDQPALRDALLRAAADEFHRTLAEDSENVAAHHNLHLIYAQLGQTDLADKHQQLHARYKPDDNARDQALAAARRRYPAANHAAEAVVIYPLRPPDFDPPAAASAPAPREDLP